MFYSKSLDKYYLKSYQIIAWLKQIFFKGAIYRFMMERSSHVEIQSPHVKNCVSDFMDINDKFFYTKSDIDLDESLFSDPKKYDFSKKINFLYIVGPHFKLPHKNMIDFITAMEAIDNRGIEFEINITVSKDQIKKYDLWNRSLNSKTIFHGYLTDKEEINKLFCDNTILISTSIIETLGLHVIEGIKNGIITIVPDEDYAHSVYGRKIFKYDLFNKDSLVNTIENIINIDKVDLYNYIIYQQQYLKKNEMDKYKNILEVFNEVLNVQE